MSDSFDRSLQGNLPLPLARLYARAYHAKGARERHDHAFHLAESALKLLGSALVARYRRCGQRSEKVDAALRHLALPSLGQWCSIFREALRFLGERPGDAWANGILERLSAGSRYPEVVQVFDVLARTSDYLGRRPQSVSILDALDLLPLYRNVMSDAHGAIKADASLYREGTRSLLGLVRLTLGDANALGDGHLVYAEEVVYRRPDEPLAVWMDLTGPSAVRLQPHEGVPTREGTLPRQLYLRLAPDEHLPLHPLLHYQPGEIVDQVFFLNRARGGKSGIQFLSYATGEFYLPGRDPNGDQLVKDLQMLLSWVTSSPVDSGKLAELCEASRFEASSRGEQVLEAELAPGARVLGDFEILEELGRGSMAIVYLARQRSLGRLAAVKVLPLGLRDDPTAVARFKQEVSALARCDHPNVVKILTSGQAEGTFYYAMELVDGADLGAIQKALQEARSKGEKALRESAWEEAVRKAGLSRKQRLEGTPLRREEAVKPPPPARGGREISFRLAEVIRDAARGVQHIHEQGIIHRDLKPQNIMLARDAGQPVVMDLGLAKMAGVSQSLTRGEGSLVGTLRYMAPEMFQRNILEIDARADVYALGTILYELACFRPMHDGDSEQRLTKQILFESPVPPQKVNRALPSDLSTIIDKATRKDAKERYASAGELAADLDRFIRGEPIAARPPSLAYALKMSLRRHKTELLAVGAAVLVLVAGFSSWTSYRKDREFQAHMDAGKSLIESYGKLKKEIPGLKEGWIACELRHETWEPVWEREDEIKAWAAYHTAQERIEYLYNEGLLQLHRARDVDSPGSSRALSAAATIQSAYLERYLEAEKEGSVSLSPGFFRRMMESLRAGPLPRQIEGRGSISLQSEPPGAEVYCFRYEIHEQHMVPLPFEPASGLADPAKGLRGEPFLEVEKVWGPGKDGKLPPFQKGDRLLRVRGQAVKLHGDLARALRDTGADEEVEAEVLRSEVVIPLRWVPFPTAGRSKPPAEAKGEDDQAGAEGDGEARDDDGMLPPGRLVSIRDQLRITFAGYPLEFLPACRVGRTQPEAPLTVELPQGSYLFVFRRAGRQDARLPVAMPFHRDASETVRLREESEVPPGFVQVPAGSFPYGGDKEASQSLEFGEARVEEFYMSRFEVTLKEYLEFLNDPKVAGAINHNGQAKPLADWSRLPDQRIVSETIRRKPLVLLIPVGSTPSGTVAFARPVGDPPQWKLNSDVNPPPVPEWPVTGVPMLAAVEYAHWLTEKSGGKWRFRLPTDLEWEKAARGVDRRIYVWGNYAVWSFCSSAKGAAVERAPDHVGAYSLDESVFGIRDLAGSVSEPTTDRTTWRHRFVSFRGGYWDTTEDQYFRAANRNGRYAEEPWSGHGIRLVAEPSRPPETGGGPR